MSLKIVNSARVSLRSKPLDTPVRIRIGMEAVSELPFSALINSPPPIVGICISVITSAGLTRFRIPSASTPFDADTTVYPRSSRKRETVCRITIESSTSNTTPGIQFPKRTRISVPAIRSNQFGAQQTQTVDDHYVRHG